MNNQTHSEEIVWVVKLEYHYKSFKRKKRYTFKSEAEARAWLTDYKKYNACNFIFEEESEQ